MAFRPEYPFAAIAEGETLEVADGVHWVRMPLPFGLDHVNLWLLEDGDGWTALDCGYNTAATRAMWTRALDAIAGGRGPWRVICTHFHPDHMGLAGWFAEVHGSRLWATWSEWMQAHVAAGRRLTHDFGRWAGFFAENGAPAEMVEGFGRFVERHAEPWHRLPGTVRRISDGEEIGIGGRAWRVITGGGHTHEHASLWCAELGILVSGDQILPRISPNVTVWCAEPDGDPLADYLASLARFEGLPADALVLPSHDHPFRGLHGRIDDLRGHHEARLEAALSACAEPRTADGAIPFLFSHGVDPDAYAFAIGESLAHLNRLVAAGGLRREAGADGVVRFVRA